MIEQTNSIMWMLDNIIEKANIIKNDFQENGEVHYDYILEKLGSANYDLQNLLSIANRYMEEEKERTNGE